MHRSKRRIWGIVAATLCALTTNTRAQTLNFTTPSITPVPNGAAQAGTFFLDARLLVGLNITPALIQFTQVGQSLQVQVTSTLNDQSAYIVTSAADNTTYTIDDPAVASVNSTGLVTALGPGMTLLNAFQLNRQARSVVIVYDSPQVTALQILPRTHFLMLD